MVKKRQVLSFASSRYGKRKKAVSDEAQPSEPKQPEPF
jgi:hypothetical protein